MAPALMSGDGAAAILIDGLKPVAPADVEAELARRMASSAPEGESPTRTCALNLLVYVDRAADIQRVASTIAPLEAAHPMRVIIVTLDPQAPAERVQAWVDVECSGATSGRVCSEQIVLVGDPDSAARLSSTVVALLGADLPVALWWRSGSPFLSRLFKGLAPLADKIVVDSVRFGDGPAALDTLHRLAGIGRAPASSRRSKKARARRVALADMNWHRIATWRSTLAACFDDPGVLALLPSLDHSEIEFSVGPTAAGQPPSARSLLLAGWLVSRMPAIAGHGDIGGTANDWATPGAVVALRLRSSDSRAGVSIAWPSARDGIVASAIDASGAQMRRWQFAPDPEGEADLLYRCIDSMSPDALLDGALEVG